MGLMERIGRVIRATLNRLIRQAEDPEKILKQSLEDTHKELIQMRQAVAQAIASQKRTEQQYNKYKSEANTWQQRAQIALQKGDENQAREALQRKKYVAKMAQALQPQLAEQREIVTQLKQNMITLEMCGDQASAQTEEMLGNIYTGKMLKAVERMENKLLKLEARLAIAQPSSGDELAR